jgi:trans-2,3-dihydro-3-hydroxyanthranilate isomerase
MVIDNPSKGDIMQKLDFHLVDVFTNEAFGGNQLAVFTDGRGISGTLMQQLAREFNFSETTFVLPPDNPKNDFRVRIFAPSTEMPTAGHPTIGTAFVLAHEQLIDTSKDEVQIVFEEIVGDIPITLNLQDGHPSIITMTQPLPEFGPLYADRQAIAEMLSLDQTDFVADLPFEVISCGVPYLIAPVRDLQAVRRIRFRNDVWEQTLKDFVAPAVFVFTQEAEREGSTVHSRMFAPSFGIVEDPATGSAGGPLGSYLVQHDLVQPDEARSIVSEQGFEIGRPSLIHIAIETQSGEISRVRVGGESCYIGNGSVFVEPD